MVKRRVGLWLIGACGSVGSTAALGLAAIARGIQAPTGMVTGTPAFRQLPLDALDQFVVGGHDIRRDRFLDTIGDLHSRSNIFTAAQIELCVPDLMAWGGNVRPGTVLQSGPSISALAEGTEVQQARTPREAVARIQADLKAFRDKNELEQVVVINVASTEPPFPIGDEHQSLERLNPLLERSSASILPASSLYAYAAIDLGLPYVNFTPSLGSSLPALDDLARLRKSPYGGKDGKTGETLLKAVLGPMFAARHLHVMSWIGHNILGGGDGRTLSTPENKSSKVRSKDAILSEILGYKPQTHVSIEYVESLDDWKTAWDHIHFEGFLGTKMTMQFTWQGCDAILASPLVLDLSRFALLAQRRGEFGVMRHLACFFKSPIGVAEHDFFKQSALLHAYVEKASSPS
jgi:myo-inositol-1-phosphate synthase